MLDTILALEHSGRGQGRNCGKIFRRGPTRLSTRTFRLAGRCGTRNEPGRTLSFFTAARDATKKHPEVVPKKSSSGLVGGGSSLATEIGPRRSRVSPRRNSCSALVRGAKTAG